MEKGLCSTIKPSDTFFFESDQISLSILIPHIQKKIHVVRNIKANFEPIRSHKKYLILIFKENATNILQKLLNKKNKNDSTAGPGGFKSLFGLIGLFWLIIRLFPKKNMYTPFKHSPKKYKEKRKKYFCISFLLAQKNI